MADPAMHNTEVRPDFWRDPNEPQEEDHPSPYSTGGDAAEDAQGETMHEEAEPMQTEEAADSTDTATNNTTDPEPVQLSNTDSYQANAQLEAQPEPEATQPEEGQISSDPSVPASSAQVAAETVAKPDDSSMNADEIPLDQSQAQSAPAFNGNVDVQALLDTLQVPPATSTVNATPVNGNVNPISPPPSQAQPAPPGIDTPGAAAALGLNAPSANLGLPARPPPQEQPLIHPNYVHSQHIRDYHPHAAHPAFQPQAQTQHGRTGSSQGNAADLSAHNYVPPVAQSPTTAAAYSPSASSANPAAVASNTITGVHASPTTAFHPTAASPTTSPQQYQQQHATPQQPQFYQPTPASIGQQQQQQQQQLQAGTTPSASDLASTLHPPLSAAQAYSQQLANTPSVVSRRESKLAAGEIPLPEDRPWDASVQQKYNAFLDAERSYVSEGNWTSFPSGSRLFVGNLSSEKVTKRDIFHVFHVYGDLAQISIKQAYGFVQFLRAEDCRRAMQGEQGRWVRDKRVHLEVSKPQKNRQSGAAQQQQNARRSRSPDYNRGRPGDKVDRYVSGVRGGGAAGRDGRRSPSPYRGYEDRSGGYRRRSPDYGRGNRYRSPSPARRNDDDDLPLPRRQPRDVPDVQILVMDSLERDFISWVEKAFSSRGVRVDVLLSSPRLDEAAVIRRQIVEGVTAISKLTVTNQNTGKIGLQIFDRRGGAGSVRFEEYEGLDPGICVELVLRAKGTNATSQPSYGGGGYGASAAAQYGAPPPQQMPPAQQYGAPNPYAPAPQQAAYGQPPPAGYPPQPQYAPQPPPQQQQPQQANLQNMISNLDPAGLQNLLSAMNQRGQGPPATPQSAGGYGGGYAGQQQAAMAALQQNPGFAQQLQQQQQQYQQQGPQQQGGAPASGQQGGAGGQVNMQDILARLGTYGR